MARSFDDATRRNIAELCAAFVREPPREPAPTLKRAAVERARLRKRMVGIEMREGQHVAFHRRDPVKTGADMLLGRESAARDLGRGFRRRELGRVSTRQVASSLAQGWVKRAPISGKP